jgi:hypothetical protein
LGGCQCVGVLAQFEGEQAADETDGQRSSGLVVRMKGALSPLDPLFRLLQPALPGHLPAEQRVSNTGRWLAGPAVPLGQLDRLPAVLRRSNRGSVGLSQRLVSQAGEHEKRPPNPARQRDALFQVLPSVLEPGRPQFGDAHADERQRA